jgi:hypothetical protein
MRWFRTNVKHGARLALFALAVQAALAFGHFHGLGVSAASAVQSDLTQTEVAANANGLGDSHTARPQTPANHHHDQQPGDLCAICAVLLLVNASTVGTPPLLLLPQASEHLYLPSAAEVVHLTTARVAFQARAPPRS